MDIVPARVHGAVHVGTEGRAPVLVNGQGVDVGPQDDRTTRKATVESEDPAGLGDPVELADVERRHTVADQ